MILVINTGSSSIKIAVFERSSLQVLAEGLAQRLGEAEADLSWLIAGNKHEQQLLQATHQSAMAVMLDVLFSKLNQSAIIAVGHRVVHGGELFVAPTVLDDLSITAIEGLSHLAPLHNPSNVIGIKAGIAALPAVPHVAVFDTAFHQTMPSKASIYAVPYAWYEDYGVRRYGFHGTSHHYVGLQAAKLLNVAFENCKLITVHLGNGCSATAIKNGKSVDTTMGLTPLSGLVMGTRSGDIDPGIFSFVASQTGQSLGSITNTLNRKSGLLGISGKSNDMRTLLAASADGDERACLAVEIFCYDLAKTLAGLAVSLGQVDAIIFTGGIGEHAALVREKTLMQLAILGVQIDAENNQHHGENSGGYISAKDSKVAALVVPTHEEKMIASYVCQVLN
ncbi:MAG: acetate kinase [Zetaproteobacteria bacterium CG2_30_46_52]|nr:MAG: acetate kinase [Zetaproteobacteria bacterium CG2_30_46_52]